jgi:hypothetical protein
MATTLCNTAEKRLQTRKTEETKRSENLQQKEELDT